MTAMTCIYHGASPLCFPMLCQYEALPKTIISSFPEERSVSKDLFRWVILSEFSLDFVNQT